LAIFFARRLYLKIKIDTLCPEHELIMTISRQALFGKLGATLLRGIESATVFCKLRGNPYVELVH
jgi:type VI secretion system protein VasG